MPDFDYSVLDGNGASRLVRGEDLGTNGSGVQIIGQKFYSDILGALADVAAVDESGNSTAISLLKGALRELIKVSTSSGSTSDAAIADEAANGTLVAIAKAQLRELIKVSAKYNEGTVSAISLGTSDTTIATIDCRGYQRLSIAIQNNGAEAFNSFQAKIRTNSSFSFYFPEATDAAAFTSGSSDQTGNPTGLIRKANGDPTTLAAGAYVWIRFNVEGVESLQISGSVAANTTSVNAWWIVE